jgi:hypothetical protein
MAKLSLKADFFAVKDYILKLVSNIKKTFSFKN